MSQGIHVIDLSGAWRLETPEYRAIYDFKDENPALADKVMAQAVYGIPESHLSELKEAALVANAGCYATSIILALAPLVGAGLVDLHHGVVAIPNPAFLARASSPRRKLISLKWRRTCPPTPYSTIGTPEKFWRAGHIAGAVDVHTASATDSSGDIVDDLRPPEFGHDCEHH